MFYDLRANCVTHNVWSIRASTRMSMKNENKLLMLNQVHEIIIFNERLLNRTPEPNLGE